MTKSSRSKGSRGTKGGSTSSRRPGRRPATKPLRQASNTYSPKGRGLPRPLAVEQTYLTCSPTSFRFADTTKLHPSHDIISQDRAVSAINLGLGIRKPGYNIYVAGIQGTGKTSVIRSFLERWSADSKTPSDWIYAHDFSDEEAPKAIALPPGGGRKLKKQMEHLVKTLREEIPKALQSEDYENAVNAYVSASNERKAKLYSDLEKLAKGLDFIIKSTRMGIETIPVVDGRSLTEKEYSKLNEAERAKIEDQRSQLEPEVLDFARRVRGIEQETAQYVESLRNELGLGVVGGAIDGLIEEYKADSNIHEFLTAVKTHILENLLEFVEIEEGEGEREQLFGPEERDPFRKYRINVFVDNTNQKGAPVIIETNPTYYNLFGRIEKNVEHGMYLTDFTMVKAGAVHRANGGYLVLNAADIFKTASIWDTLKRVLKNRQGFIEDMGEQYSLLPTSGLRPVPVPLDIKVILIGNDEIYHMLYDLDEDFHKIFKIKADFDWRMPRTTTNVEAYANFVATRTKVENLLPFDRDGIAAVVEYGSRLVEDQRFLSTQFGEIKDLSIESDYLARADGAEAVTRQHVEKALDEKYHRVSLVEEQILDTVKQEDVLLSVDGERVGQVNGLAVYDMGDYSFGKIGRITCTISHGDDGVFNIERMSKLSGKIHDKGMHILTGFLTSILARDKGLGVGASLCFEQSYGLIDGDSATVAELTAVLSALGEVPVRQNVAMTGSLDQFGQVQPVGGVNEKIEGFFKTASLIGKGQGPYQVLVPAQNVPNLMLKSDVRAAIKNGSFAIFPIRNINEAFELATGQKLGYVDAFTKSFAAGTVLERIAARLDKLHRHKHHGDSGAAKNKEQEALQAKTVQPAKGRKSVPKRPAKPRKNPAKK